MSHVARGGRERRAFIPGPFKPSASAAHSTYPFLFSKHLLSFTHARFPPVLCVTGAATYGEIVFGRYFIPRLDGACVFITRMRTPNFTLFLAPSLRLSFLFESASPSCVPNRFVSKACVFRHRFVIACPVLTFRIFLSNILDTFFQNRSPAFRNFPGFFISLTRIYFSSLVFRGSLVN